jgi:hypothetical protein
MLLIDQISVAAGGPNWTMVSAVANALYVVAFSGTIWYIHHQLKAVKKASQTESVLRVLEYLHDPELRRPRWFVFHGEAILSDLFAAALQASDGWERLDGVFKQSAQLEVGLEFRQLELSLKALDNVASLIRHKESLVPYDPIAKTLLKSEFLRWWNTFLPYIKWRRLRTRSKLNRAHIADLPEPEYCENLQMLIADIRGIEPRDTLVRPV